MFKVITINLEDVGERDYNKAFYAILKAMLDTGNFTLEDNMTYQNIVDMNFCTDNRQKDLSFNIKFKNKVFNISQPKTTNKTIYIMNYGEQKTYFDISAFRKKAYLIYNDSMFFIQTYSQILGFSFLDTALSIKGTSNFTLLDRVNLVEDAKLIRLPTFLRKDTLIFPYEMNDIVCFYGTKNIPELTYFRFDNKKYFYIDDGLAVEVE